MGSHTGVPFTISLTPTPHITRLSNDRRPMSTPRCDRQMTFLKMLTSTMSSIGPKIMWAGVVLALSRAPLFVHVVHDCFPVSRQTRKLPSPREIASWFICQDEWIVDSLVIGSRRSGGRADLCWQLQETLEAFVPRTPPLLEIGQKTLHVFLSKRRLMYSIPAYVLY